MVVAEHLLLNSMDNKRYYRYLLLDGLETINELNRLHLDNLTQELGDENIYTIPRPEIKHDLASCPKLVLLATPQKEVDQSLVQIAVERAQKEYLFRKNYICGFFSSDLAPLDMVAGILSLGMSLGNMFQLPFLPFYEPFRMQLLQYGNRMCPEWLPTVLNIFNQYSYFSMQKELKTISALEDKKETPELFITYETRFYQKELKKIQALYIAWSEICEKNSNINVDDNDVILLAEYYQDSQRLGLINTQDSFIYVLYRRFYGDLLKNGLIKQAITDAINEQGSLLKRFNLIDENVFIQLRTKK